MIDRRTFAGSSILALSTLGTAEISYARDAARVPVLIVQTLLKSVDGRDMQLARFLELNWLAMDRRGIARGLFSHATLSEVLSESGSGERPAADFVVEVGYFTPEGYATVQRDFEQIHNSHKQLLIDGMGLRDLGQIVGERQFRVRARA
jgi:hypothetical protein